MNRYVYLYELRKELSFMNPEDREAAVRYYEEHFADAGVENEKDTIDHLGPPSSLAAEIRKEYEDGKTQPNGRDLTPVGGKTAGEDKGSRRHVWQGEHWVGPNPPWRAQNQDQGKEQYGPETASREENTNTDARQREQSWNSRYQGNGSDKWEQRSSAWSQKASEFGEKAGYKAGKWGQKVEEKAYEWTDKANAWWGEKKKQYRERGYGEKNAHASYEQDASQQRQAYYGPRSPYREKKRLDTWVIVLLAIFAIPVGIPLAAGIFGVLIGLIASIFALFIALIAASGGLIVGGLISICTAPFYLFQFGDLLVNIGSGLVMLAVGVPLMAFSIWITKKCFRGCSKVIRNVWRKLRGNRGMER